MRIELETIGKDSKSPFRLLHNPRLNHLFYWHFHPEYELVYIEGASAIRHVGDHISNYTHSDLVLIGSNIPHLNFDHGVETSYKKDVLHIKPSLRQQLISEIPELASVHQLFERSKHGIAFFGKTRKLVGKRMQGLHRLSGFLLFIEVLQLLEILSHSEEYVLLHDHPFVNRYNRKEQERLRSIYAYVDERYQQKIGLEEVALFSNLGKEAFCRYFKKATGTTFVQFLNQYRISQAKRLLLAGKNSSEACYECGFESLSYFNRIFKKVTGGNPSEFKKKHLNAIS